MWTKHQIAKFIDEQPDNAEGDEILRKLFMTIAIKRGMAKGDRKQALRYYEQAQFDRYESGYPIERMPEYIHKSAFLTVATASPDFITELTGEQIYPTDDGTTYAIVDVFASYVAMTFYRSGLIVNEITIIFNRIRHAGWSGVTNNLKNGQTLLILRGNQAEFIHEDVTFDKMRELKERPYLYICIDLLYFFLDFQENLMLIPEYKRKFNE